MSEETDFLGFGSIIDFEKDEDKLMTNEDKIRWLLILKEAEKQEGFTVLFDEDEEIDLQAFLDEIIYDYAVRRAKG